MYLKYKIALITISLNLFTWAEQKYNFPAGFLWGTAICEYQNSGAENCPNCNWAKWEADPSIHSGSAETLGMKSRIKNGQKSGKSCDFWNNYKSDIKLMQDFGLNSLRFSVEWSRIEPQEGVIDQDAIEHYIDLVNELKKAGIEPLVTLHHFTNPNWFDDKGGFEKEENIKYFVNFCTRIFEKLSDKVSLWCTINEPNIYMFQGYMRGVFPPGKCNFPLALKVLRNLMQAHTESYLALKSMKNGDKAQIGFAHQYLEFQPYRWWNLAERCPGYFLNYVLNTLILNFVETGELRVPLLGYNYKAPVKKVVDYFGLNYYSRVLMKMQCSLTEPMVSSCYPHEVMTDMPYAIYADGLYNTIKKLSKLNLPIYITENGIADERDDRRETYIKQYTQALEKAISENCDVRGYFYWTLMDNFEWDEGRLMKFGLYQVDLETQMRTLRPGAKLYSEIVKNTKVN